MSLQEKLNKLPINAYSAILPIFLLLIVVIIVYYRVKVQLEIGPMWDTYDFLSNALWFAGKSSGYTDLNRPPLLPFLTSIFFRFGEVSEAIIFTLDGIFFGFWCNGYLFIIKTTFQ